MSKKFSLVILFVLAAIQAPGIARDTDTVSRILDAAGNYGEYKQAERRRERADDRRDERRKDNRHHRNKERRHHHRH